MNNRNWLPLMEYSAKYRVSLSTLRRRIKTGEIEYKFADGKYLLGDGPLKVALPAPETVAPPKTMSSRNMSGRNPEAKERVKDQDPHWQATQALLVEIKKAYSLILQEKEEQIIQLKEEVADLKTLVRVLEQENIRMKDLQPKLDLDLGL